MITSARPAHPNARLLVAALALVAGQPAVPLMGFSNQDFQAEAVVESADRALLKGWIIAAATGRPRGYPALR